MICRPGLPDDLLRMLAIVVLIGFGLVYALCAGPILAGVITSGRPSKASRLSWCLPNASTHVLRPELTAH